MAETKPSARLWDDTGWASQGKILTAVLQDDQDAARFRLRQWSGKDLLVLRHALHQLEALIAQEQSRRIGGRLDG